MMLIHDISKIGYIISSKGTDETTTVGMIQVAATRVVLYIYANKQTGSLQLCSIWQPCCQMNR